MGADGQREDALETLRYREHIVKHHPMWLDFARSVKGRDISLEDLILVTGCDKTSKWACATWSEKMKSAMLKFSVAAGAISGGVSLWATMESPTSIVRNVGPNNLAPSDRAHLVLQMSPNYPSEGNNNTTISPDGPTSATSLFRTLSSFIAPFATIPHTEPLETFDQCVFLRGFQIADRYTWEKIKALVKVTDGTTTNLKHSVPQSTRSNDSSQPSRYQQQSSSPTGQTGRSSGTSTQVTFAGTWIDQGGFGPHGSENDIEFTRQNFDAVSSQIWNMLS